MTFRIACVWGLVLLACCLLPANERVELDRAVGRARAKNIELEIRDGLAGVRSFDGATLQLWAQAPVLDVDVTLTDDAPRSLRIELLNCMRDAVLSVEQTSSTSAAKPLSDWAAGCRFDVGLEREQTTLHIAPADAARNEPYVFAVLSDIQRGIGQVQEVFERMNEDAALRFVVSTGDLANTGVRPELVAVQDELRVLRVPLFSTVGNHEMGAEPRHWHELFGPFNPHFAFKGVTFSLIDSGNATVDPDVYGWLDEWLDAARDEVHMVLTHVPPLDPVGIRGGGFRSRKEAGKLLARLGNGKVDALFLGHIHSYYAFSSAGVPTYISGGGGAIQEELDGIGRHYLRVSVSAKGGIDDVAIVRID
jgi:hypothetical protein